MWEEVNLDEWGEEEGYSLCTLQSWVDRDRVGWMWPDNVT